MYIYINVYIYTHLWRDCHDSPNFPLNFVRAVRASNAGSPSPKSRTKLPVPGPPRGRDGELDRFVDECKRSMGSLILYIMICIAIYCDIL